MRIAAFFVLGGLFACSSIDPAVEDDRAGSSPAEGAPRPTASAHAEDTTSPAAKLTPLPTPRLRATNEKCKLISNNGIDDPTANNTHFKANLRATDLGIPVQHDGTVYFLFGDSVGYKGIWQFGESQPDAVGFANAADLARDPGTLCNQMNFLTLPPDASVGPKQDTRVVRDWAAVSMTAPAGKNLDEFIHNPAGHGKFANLPGDFEVPSGAFSANGSVYVFYTTVDAAIQMKGSYLAKWVVPTTTGQPNLDILYHVDERFDASGAMHGDFINNASLVDGEYVYVYGTGDYRKSVVNLARKKLSTLATEGGFERFDATTKSWRPANEATTPIVDVPAIGELSVRFFPSIGRYMMLGQEVSPTRNQIVARFASKPEGPWSTGVLVNDMGDPGYRAKYCCQGDSCNGDQLFHCDRAGFYGSYLLPEVQKNADGTFTASFTMSTWDPYNVALMQATFE